jgi:hypothetical protein
MELLVLSGHICNWGLSLLYAKRSALLRPLDWGSIVGREVQRRTTTGSIIGAGRAANLSGDFLPAHSVKTLHCATIQRIVDFNAEIPVGEKMAEEWK